MDYEFYITPEEYELAESRGITRSTLERRIRLFGWSKKKALTTESQKRIDRSEWYPIAESNGISKKLFLARVNKNKWSCERAATEKVTYTAERNRKYSDGVYKALEENGISKEMFYDRIRKGWDMQRAMTEKKWTDEEKLNKMSENFKNIDNHFKDMNKAHWMCRTKYMEG